MSRLKEEIQKLQNAARKKIPADIQVIMQKATQQLENDKISKNALQKGSTAKSFNLPNAVNELVNLDTLLVENDYIVLNFYRGLWCPYCNLELKALEGISEELKKLNATIVAISPQTPDASLTTKEKNELSFEVLSDEKNIAAKEYGLVYSLAEELKPVYEKFGIDIPLANDDNSYELPMPAIYLINKNKEILYSFVDENHQNRCEPQIILDIIQKNLRR